MEYRTLPANCSRYRINDLLVNVNNAKVKRSTRSRSCPDHTNVFCPVPAVKLLGIMLTNRCWPTIFLKPEMPTDGAKSGGCDPKLRHWIRQRVTYFKVIGYQGWIHVRLRRVGQMHHWWILHLFLLKQGSRFMPWPQRYNFEFCKGTQIKALTCALHGGISIGWIFNLKPNLTWPCRISYKFDEYYKLKFRIVPGLNFRINP